ncbi:hypothetical protein A2U01_0093252, partial [Trifolium medium]|nr:hypothetical protein [Trifolium medium]
SPSTSFNVSTSVTQSGQYVETIQYNPSIESEYESSSENEDSQSKMVTGDGEKKKVSDDVGLSEVSVWSVLLL